MKIILANPRGFCAGVNMAIESLERALECFGTPLYVYHEIVHNRPVVERFRKRFGADANEARLRMARVPDGASLVESANAETGACVSSSAAVPSQTTFPSRRNV